jgi:hypothetical protein
MTDIRHPELLRSLRTTKYPFTPTSSLSNGSVFFVEDTFLDAHIYSVAGSGRYYISQVTVQSDKFTIYVGNIDNPLLLSGTVSLPVSATSIRLTDSYGRPGGVLITTPERIALLSTWGVQTHTFELSQTEFCVTCQVPFSNNGVNGIRTNSTDLVSEKVWLVGEDGVVLRTDNYVDKSGNNVNVIRVDIVGDPLNLQRLCNPADLFVPINPIRIIRVVNGDYTYDCEPDEQGNFNIQMNEGLVSDPALRIRTTPVGIVFSVEGSLLTK